MPTPASSHSPTRTFAASSRPADAANRIMPAATYHGDANGEHQRLHGLDAPRGRDGAPREQETESDRNSDIGNRKPPAGPPIGRGGEDRGQQQEHHRALGRHDRDDRQKCGERAEYRWSGPPSVCSGPGFRRSRRRGFAENGNMAIAGHRQALPQVRAWPASTTSSTARLASGTRRSTVTASPHGALRSGSEPSPNSTTVGQPAVAAM